MFCDYCYFNNYAEMVETLQAAFRVAFMTHGSGNMAALLEGGGKVRAALKMDNLSVCAALRGERGAPVLKAVGNFLKMGHIAVSQSVPLGECRPKLFAFWNYQNETSWFVMVSYRELVKKIK
jgi:hypothetical protein